MPEQADALAAPLFNREQQSTMETEEQRRRWKMQHSSGRARAVGTRQASVIAVVMAITLTVTGAGGINAVGATTGPVDYANLVDDRYINVQSASDVAAKRQELIQFVWGSPGFPATKLPVVERNVVSPITAVEHLKRVDRLRFAMEKGERNLAYHLIPRRPNNRVVIVHQGHACRIDDSGPGNDGIRQTIDTLLGDGFDVIAMYMPHYTPEDCRVGAMHDDMFGTVADGSPMKFFLEPVALTMNYLKGVKPGYHDYSMTGLSGGGWTTTVYSAIDPTIRRSFPVAGSIPLYLRAKTPLAGDAEQVLPDFYRIAGYLDLYVLGSSGEDRKQVQILNRRDQCCFGQYQHVAGVEAWEPDIRDYEVKVRTALADIGSGSFSLEIDEPAPNHTISPYAANMIVADINGSHPDVGAASTSDAFVRGANGNILHRTPAGWNDTGIAAVGVPAVLERSPHTFDLFFRDPGNWLKHAFLSDTGWVVESLGGSAISDPVAVAQGGGRWDVVTVGTDYRLYHYSWRPGWSFIGFGRMSETVLAHGTPALVSSEAGRLHAFFRGSDRRISQLRFNGSFPWVLEPVGASPVMDVPSAAVTFADARPTLRVYTRAPDNLLGEMWQRDGGAWNAVPVSRVSGAKSTTLIGSPDAAVSSGTVTVYERTTAAGIAAFELSATGWEFSNRGGRITGSPTAVPGGAWARGFAGDLQLLDGSTWTSKGGVVQ